MRYNFVCDVMDRNYDALRLLRRPGVANFADNIKIAIILI